VSSCMLGIPVLCFISDSSVALAFTMDLCKDIFRMSEGEWELSKCFRSSGRDRFQRIVTCGSVSIFFEILDSSHVKIKCILT
jgi:hypothetical protein